MSSDWLSLFVHQGREFIDSVSRKNKDDDPKLAAAKNMATKNEPTSETEQNTEKDLATVTKPENETELSSEKPSTSSSKETLSSAEKYIYEAQLEQLQEQLVDIMIQNQEMESELNCLRNSDVCKLSKELEREQSKRRQLEERLSKRRNDDGSPILRRRKRRVKDGSSNAPDECDDQKTNEANDKPTTSLQPELEEPTSQEPSGRLKRARSWFYNLYIALSQRVTLTIWDIVSDLSDEDTPLDAEDVDGPPLAVKTLKDNIRRFRRGIKPISEFSNKTSWVLSWKNPAATMLIFLVYVFSFWHGYTVSLLIFLGIVQLSANFFYNKFGSISPDDETESPESTASWSDRFQIVLHVARKVQNVLGFISDHLEKIKNLLMWKVLHVTFKLYIALWVLLFASVVLTGPQFFTLLGMFLGYKLFIQNPIYKRFPKLQRRYDTTLRLWNELPFDSESAVNGRTIEPEEGQTAPLPPSDISKLNSQLFCERYKLTSDEVLVRGWEEGWRTSLMNKNRPLVNIKHGRLYLTQNYLCFERSRTNIEKNILLKLSSMRSVNKYKPLYILPGTGMSIEVCMKDKDEPYIFAAILGRDDAYNDIIQAAKNAGLAWALAV